MSQNSPREPHELSIVSIDDLCELLLQLRTVILELGKDAIQVLLHHSPFLHGPMFSGGFDFVLQDILCVIEGSLLFVFACFKFLGQANCYNIIQLSQPLFTLQSGKTADL